MFYSIQGEGRFTGYPAIFVRFSGCNRKCDFCDTLHETGNEIDLDQLMILIESMNTSCKRIILTGGEPLLQVDEALIDTLHRSKYTIHIETNGTIIPDFPLRKIDWLTVSPKEVKSGVIIPGITPEVNYQPNLKGWNLNEGDELKVVFTGQLLNRYFASSFTHYYLQPCSMSNVQETIKEVMDDHRWSLSYQLQKEINIQ